MSVHGRTRSIFLKIYNVFTITYINFSHVYFQQITQERYMNPKYVYLEYWIKVLYYLQNMMVDVQKI